MPNRILRDWTASEKLDKLSIGAEVFFTRLIMKADDYGLYYGNPKLLNSALFPLKEYDNSQVFKWAMECVKAGIIHKYTVDDKDYIQILGFDQRLRLMKSKFPAPPKIEEFHERSNDGQMTDMCPHETKRNEVETEVENETETNALRATLPAIFFGEDVNAAWLEWEQYRKEKKQKLTPSTKKKQMQFLGGRAGPEAIAIINQSITNGWTGLFELKQNNNGNRPNNKGTSATISAQVGGTDYDNQRW
jgi:hypothetical protein